jgi:TetR/AcrR family transcriptional repressor of nem operon
MLIDSYLGMRHRDNRGSGCLVVAVGADMARLRGAARAGYARGFAQHLDRLSTALRLSEDPERNRERVTQLMSSLVGALLFARAIEDPGQSDAMLHSMRRQLRAQFCCESPTPEARSAAVPANDFMRAF